MKILVVNAGSSSLKYQVIDMDNEQMICKGLVERIGSDNAKIEHKKGDKKFSEEGRIATHTNALKKVISLLTDAEYGVVKSICEIGAVGHRVLHSGEDFKHSVLIDDEVIKICKKNAVLGPLHMPANIACIESCREVMPGTPMVAVFDTSFHSTMPAKAYMYAIPYEYYDELKIRKYGFHGTSHKFIAGEARKYLGEKGKRIVICHLGNGSSMTAVLDGKCIDTTMGLTPLEGLVMGTRSGDIDPSVVEFLAVQKGMTAQESVNMLNKKSGFLGIVGASDFRDVCNRAKSGDEKAILGVDMFAYRIKKYIGAYSVALGGLDAVIFTGGIGENSDYGRAKIMEGLDVLGIDFDFELNAKAPRGDMVELSKPDSKVRVLIIPTNEELVIARDTKEIVEK